MPFNKDILIKFVSA